MISTRAIFIFVTLFLAMAMTILSAPVVDNEWTTTQPTKPPTDMKNSTGPPEVITTKLLFANASLFPIVDDMKTGKDLLFKKDGDQPNMPSTVSPVSDQVKFPGDNSIEKPKSS
jgi:hypothetical protein